LEVCRPIWNPWLTSMTMKRAEKNMRVDHSTRQRIPSTSRRSASIRRKTAPTDKFRKKLFQSINQSIHGELLELGGVINDIRSAVHPMERLSCGIEWRKKRMITSVSTTAHFTNSPQSRILHCKLNQLQLYNSVRRKSIIDSRWLPNQSDSPGSFPLTAYRRK